MAKDIPLDQAVALVRACQKLNCDTADQLFAMVERRSAEANDRLRAACEACGASFISNPCTVAEGHSLLAAEFRRRMEIANAALQEAMAKRCEGGGVSKRQTGRYSK